MATGYTRNDTANNIATGNTINASDLDGEFDAIQSAMDATTGHTHDGTVGGGAPIVSIGPVQDVVITTSALRPKTDNTVDLGTSTFEFKDLFIDGTANIDTLQVDESATIAANLTVTGSATITTNLTVNGNTTIGNADTDTVTVTADVASHLIPSADNTYDLGASTDEWRNLYIDGIAQVDTLQVDESATITANLTVTGSATITTNLTVNGNTTIGNTDTDTITVTADVASHLIPSADNTYDLGASTDEWRDLYIDGTATIDTLQVDESATISANLTVNGNTTLGNADTDTVTVNADFASSLIPDVDNTYDLGFPTNEWRNLYINGTAQVDTLQVDESATITANLTVNGNTTLGNAATDTVTVTADVASNLIPSADNTYNLGETGSGWKDLYITGTANIDSLVADTAAISAGTATLSAATVITTTGGTVTLQRNDAAIITGETLGAVNFQAPNVSGGGNATLVTASIKAVSDATFDTTVNKTSMLLQTASAGVAATRVEVTGDGHVLPGTDGAYDLGSTTKEWQNLWVDGTANIDSLIADTADINAGTIDGTTVGATAASTGAFTTLSASSTVSGTGFSTYLASPPTIGATTPALGYFSGLYLPAASTESIVVELGTGRAGNGPARIDLISDATNTDFGMRIIKNSGVNGTSFITHKGTGTFTLETFDLAVMSLDTNNTPRITIGATGGVTVTSLAGSGTRTVTAGTTGNLSTLSDSRLKQEVPTAPIPGLAEVMRLEPKAYKWLDDIENRGESAAVEIGFFADQVRPIIPSAAPMGNDGYYGFYDRAVTAALTKAIQEQQEVIVALEARIAALEA